MTGRRNTLKNLTAILPRKPGPPHNADYVESVIGHVLFLLRCSLAVSITLLPAGTSILSVHSLEFLKFEWTPFPKPAVACARSRHSPRVGNRGMLSPVPILVVLG